MAALDRRVLRTQFEGELVRGVIVYFAPDDLDDSSAQGRAKYAVLLNLALPEPELLYSLFTSQVEKYRRFASEVLTLAGGSYEFLPQESILNLRDVRTVALERLFEKYVAARVAFRGPLRKDHLLQADELLRRSVSLSRRTTRRVVRLP